MTLRMNKRLARVKTIKKQKHFNLNRQKLKDMKERFERSKKKKKNHAHTHVKNLRKR